MLPRLLVRDRTGRQVFRFWQAGPGFDRYLFTVKAVHAAIAIATPVARGLRQKARDWRWSRFYESDATIIEPLHLKIAPLPADFWHGP